MATQAMQGTRPASIKRKRRADNTSRRDTPRPGPGPGPGHATPLHPVLGAHGQPGNDGPDGDEPGVVRAVKGERAGGGSRNTFVALHPVSFHWQLVGLKVERSISS